MRCMRVWALEASWRWKRRLKAADITSSASLSWATESCDTAERQLTLVGGATGSPALQLSPMDFAVPTSQMQLDFREICRQLLLLAGWKRRKTVFPPPSAMLGGAANRFATPVSPETGMQCDELSRKGSQRLP